MPTLLLALFLMIFPFPAQAAPSHFPLLAEGGAGGWLNVKRPLTVEDIQGRLVLLDFWTYGCINCIQIVPDLEYLEHAFGDKLLVIGVHSAKFRAEQGNERILAAAKRFGLKHPVINDSDFYIWRDFGVRAWPTLILLGPDGREISRYEGEGHRDHLERDIRAHLDSATTSSSLQDIIKATEDTGTLSFPARLAYKDGLFYTADSGHNRIVAFDKDGAIKAVIGSGARGFEDGDLSSAQFNNPRGLTFLGDDLYIADTNNHALRRVNLTTGAVTTVAGTGRQGWDRRAENADALKQSIASPWDIEPLGDGRTLAIAMAGTHQLWSYNATDKTLSVLAGSGRENIDDGNAAAATLAQPSGLSRAGDALFFADAESSALRVLEKGKVKTLIGTGLFDFGLKDGKYPDAMLQHPQGLFADENRVIIADTYNNALRLYDRKTGVLSTLTLQGGELLEPGDIIVVDDTAWVADTNHHAIKKIDLETGLVSAVPLH